MTLYEGKQYKDIPKKVIEAFGLIQLLAYCCGVTLRSLENKETVMKYNSSTGSYHFPVLINLIYLVIHSMFISLPRCKTKVINRRARQVSRTTKGQEVIYIFVKSKDN